MKTAAECLAKAAELDEMALQCSRVEDRAHFTETANGWRVSAALARAHEAYEAELVRRSRTPK